MVLRCNRYRLVKKKRYLRWVNSQLAIIIANSDQQTQRTVWRRYRGNVSRIAQINRTLAGT